MEIIDLGDDKIKVIETTEKVVDLGAMKKEIEDLEAMTFKLATVPEDASPEFIEAVEMYNRAKEDEKMLRDSLLAEKQAELTSYAS
jgi:hypothetical protein